MVRQVRGPPQYREAPMHTTVYDRGVRLRRFMVRVLQFDIGWTHASV